MSKKPWYLQIFCTHFYVELYMFFGWPDPHYLFQCERCGKEIVRRNLPVNPVKPSKWEIYEQEIARGNAHLVMSPPIITPDAPSA